MKLKSSFNFKLSSKEAPKKFCLKTSLGIVSLRVYLNLNKDFLTVKVGKTKVWRGSFERKKDNVIDFTEKNLDVENKKDSKKFESVDQIVHHYTHEMIGRMTESEKGDSGSDNGDEGDEVDWNELEEKLKKFTSK